jgi:hypothetical protein
LEEGEDLQEQLGEGEGATGIEPETAIQTRDRSAPTPREGKQANAFFKEFI